MPNSMKVFAIDTCPADIFSLIRSTLCSSCLYFFFRGGGVAPVSSCWRVTSLAVCSLLKMPFSFTIRAQDVFWVMSD